MTIFTRKPKEQKPETAVVKKDPSFHSILPPGSTDEMVIELWKNNHRSLHTRAAYAQDIKVFREFTHATPLQEINLLHLQEFLASLQGQAEATIARRISAVKSLLTFCYKSGYRPVNVGAALQAPTVDSNLAERIMSEEQALKIIALETNMRNHAILSLLYASGTRVSELCHLRWSDVQPRGDGYAWIHVLGKKNKPRNILIKPGVYQELLNIRNNATDEQPVFVSRKQHGPLDRWQINEIVERAAIRASVAIYQQKDKNGKEKTRSHVSPHWFRHAHGTHASERGAPIALVRDTLGHSSIAITNQYQHARPGQSSGDYLPL